MKRGIIVLLCMVFAINLSGQIRSHELPEVKVTPPRFTGVMQAPDVYELELSDPLLGYLVENFQYPENNDFLDEGTEVIQFTVTDDGKLTNFIIVNSITPEIDQEMIRVLKTTEGMWKPGSNSGQKVDMQQEVALTIKTAETDLVAQRKDFLKSAQIYFRMASKRFLVKRKPKRAMKYYDQGIKLYPYSQSLYYMRGLCLYELGNVEKARNDWKRLKELGGIDYESIYLAGDLTHLKGYEEFASMFLNGD